LPAACSAFRLLVSIWLRTVQFRAVTPTRGTSNDTYLLMFAASKSVEYVSKSTPAPKVYEVPEVVVVSKSPPPPPPEYKSPPPPPPEYYVKVETPAATPAPEVVVSGVRLLSPPPPPPEVWLL
jgi:hypothetical protein